MITIYSICYISYCDSVHIGSFDHDTDTLIIILQDFLLILNSSELIENLEEMFPRCYINDDDISSFKSVITHWCVTPLRKG